MADFTAALVAELEKTNQCFSRWVENKADSLESSHAKFTQSLEEYGYTIQAVRERESQLEKARPHNNDTKQRQRSEIERYVALTEKLKTQKGSLEKQLVQSEEEEERERQRLESTRAEHDALRLKLEHSINDLTHGVRLFTSLGLEFQPSEGECIKFLFTQIDPRDPSRHFFFLMFVDAAEKFNVFETNPPLDPTFLVEQLRILNTAPFNLAKFVVRVRKAFQSLVF